MNYKVVFSDIDGTLFDHKSMSVPTSAIRAVEDMQAKGILFFLCSGRSRYLMKDVGILKVISPDGLVTMNGAQAFYKDKLIYENPIKEETVSEAIRLSEKEKLPLALADVDYYFVNILNERVYKTQEAYGLPEPIQRDFPNPYDKKVYQMLLYADKEEEKKILPYLNGLKTVRWDKYGLFLMPPDSSKASGMKGALKAVNIPIEEAIAIGDDYNDIEMIKEAGIGIAMGNGHNSAKEAADYVTEDISLDGFAKAMLHFGLIDKVKQE